MKRISLLLLVIMLLLTQFSAVADRPDLSSVSVGTLSKAERTILKITLSADIAKVKEGKKATGAIPSLGVQFSDYSLTELQAFYNRITGEPVQDSSQQSDTDHQILMASVERSVKKHFDSKQPIAVNLYGKNLLIEVSGKDNLTTNMIKTGMLIGIYEVMSENRNPPVDFDFLISFPLIDKLGNRQLAIVMKVTYKSETMAKINWDRFLHIDVQDAADRYWEHPAFTK